MKSWEEISGQPLIFPIKGKEYVVQPLSIDQGKLALDILMGKLPEWTERPMEDFYVLILGDTWEQMRADGVPLDAAYRVGMSAEADLQLGREAAEHMWETGIDPEALAAWMAAAQTETTPESSTNSTGSESESGTPSPASISPTTSQAATDSSVPSPKPKAARSRGASSSAAGT